MASRNIEVVISARDHFTGTANKVIGSLNRMDSAAGRVGKGVGQVGMGLARVAVIGATAAAGGLTLVAKKTIDWESALAGVNKTMDLTPGELQAIGTDIRKLATEIPLSANALAGLVEQAGALGIKKQDVLAFAEATATIGVTTNVAADQAASSLGILSNLLGLTGKDFERFGSSLVDLGNKGASTEDQIIAIAERGAGAAATIGLSAQALLGWASAIANIGMEPEAAGTSFQRFALGVQKFTRLGAAELDVLAKTAGVSAKAFAKAFDEDASGALESFIDGLARLTKGERLDVITKLGFGDARIGRMLLGLATAEDKSDNLSKSLNISSEAWRANTAAAVEADKRYATVASKLALLNNQFTEGALLIGEGFLPALGRVADKLRIALGDESVRNDLRSFGKDIGDAIEGIDFNAVLAGAREFVSLLKGAASVAMVMFNAVNALPGPIKEAGLGFLALNKLSGGLIGAGAANILGGTLEVITRSAGSRLPGAAGRLFAQPVFVTNWPIGGMGGGGVVAGGSALGRVASVASKVFIVGAAVGVFSELLDERSRQSEANKEQATALNVQAKTFTDTASIAALAQSLRGITSDRNRLNREFSPEGFAFQLNIDGVRDAVDRQAATVSAALRDSVAGQQAAFATRDREGNEGLIAAVRGIRPPEVTVINNISGTSVSHTVTRTKRYGPIGGSRHISGGPQEF